MASSYLWFCTSQDKRGKRFRENWLLKKSAPFFEIENNLGSLLEEGRETVEMWTEKELESADDNLAEWRLRGAVPVPEVPFNSLLKNPVF